MNENMKINPTIYLFIFVHADLDSSCTLSPPHYNYSGPAFVPAESAPSREMETSSYYKDEQIICWCARCQGTYQLPQRQCRSHESEYDLFRDAPLPLQQDWPMVSVFYILLLFSFCIRKHKLILYYILHVGICSFR